MENSGVPSAGGIEVELDDCSLYSETCVDIGDASLKDCCALGG